MSYKWDTFYIISYITNETYCITCNNNSMININIKIKLKEVRKTREFSVRQLAYLSGVSKTHISAIENNNVMPTVLTLFQLAAALNVHPMDLIECDILLEK